MTSRKSTSVSDKPAGFVRGQPAGQAKVLCFASHCDARQRVQQKAVILHHTSRYETPGSHYETLGSR